MKNSREKNFDFLIENAIFIKNGVYVINQEVLDEINKNGVGMYQYTKKRAYVEKKYKGGQTTRGLDRILEQIKSSEFEPILIVSWIPTEFAKINGFDQKIHRDLHKNQKTEYLYITDPKNSAGTEWSYYPNDNPDELWRDYLKDNQTRCDLELTIWQLDALDIILSKKKENKNKIIAELAARFGKTTLFLALFDLVAENTMIIGSYSLTALASFKKEIPRWTQFKNFVLIDASSESFIQEYTLAVENINSKIVILVSLCGSSRVEKNSEFISNIRNKITIIDEADYGAHTKNVSPLVNKIGKNGIIILTTGTNSDRAKGEHNNIDFFFKYTYFDMLLKKNDKNYTLKNIEINCRYRRAENYENFVADVRFTRLDWSKLGSIIENRDTAPSFSKASLDVYKATQFWTTFYEILSGESNDAIANDNSIFNVVNQYGENVQSVIQFVTMRKSEMTKLKSIADARLGKYFDVHIVNSDIVKGKYAEEQVVEWIRIAHKNKKHVWIIASFMCQRSFSIPDINIAILSYDRGAEGATIQKMSRPLTAGINKKIGHIISLSIDGNRDDKIATIITETAMKLTKDSDENYVDIIRKVLRIMPISQMDENGYLVKMIPDEYAKEIFSKSDSHRLIVNKDRIFDFNVKDDSYKIILNCNVNNALKTKIPVDIKRGKTYINKKEKSVNKRDQKNKELIFLIEKLNIITDNISFSLKLLKLFGKNFKYCDYINMLNADINLSDGVGIDGIQLDTLIKENYISKHLINLYIECGV